MNLIDERARLGHPSPPHPSFASARTTQKDLVRNRVCLEPSHAAWGAEIMQRVVPRVVLQRDVDSSLHRKVVPGLVERLHVYTNPRMPILARLGLVDISAFNGVEWVLKNDTPAHKLVSYYDGLELTELKDAACLPRATPTALIRAPKPIGLGHRERADKIGVAMNQRLVKCWNSTRKLERDTCRDSVEFFRQANAITLLGASEKLQMHSVGVEVVVTRDWPIEFCGWDVRKMTWAKTMKLPVMGWPIIALAQCLRTGISVVTMPGDRIGVRDICSGEEAVTNANQISDRMHLITDNLWIEGLKMCNRKYPTKNLSQSQRKYMKAWFSNKGITEAAVRTLIKAYAMALPTSVNVKLWSSNGDGMCVCGRPGTQAHVLGGWCPTVRAMAVLRHNEIVQELVNNTMTKGAAAWSMVGEPDVLPPDSLFASRRLER